MSSKSRRFDDPEYVKTFRDSGAFPRIHDDIAAVVSNYAAESEPSLDLGACTGLFCHRLVKIRNAPVLGIDASLKALCQAPAHPMIRYELMKVEDSTLRQLTVLLQEVRPTLVVARRVLPEIGAKDPRLVNRLAGVFFAFGVQKIIIEGRVPSPQATSPLSDVNKEVAALEDFYRPVTQFKACAVLISRSWNRRTLF